MDESRSSLSSNLDWNDGSELERYCTKQKKIEKEMGFRPSQYFGAIDVQELEDGIGDPKIDQLFSECFGIKPKPVKKKSKHKSQNRETKIQQENFQKQQQQQYQAKQMESYQPQVQTQGQVSKVDNNHNLPLQNKIAGNNNNIQNDQSSKIILNFYNLNSNIVKQSPQSNPANLGGMQVEDENTMVLQDKSNKMIPKQQQPQNCQVLHQEQQSSKNYYSSQSLKANHKNSQHQESLQKYMSPSEIQKLKHTKNSSKYIIDTENNNNFEAGFYKTADPRQQTAYSKTSYTQVNSPQSTLSNQSTHQFSRHLQQLSSLIGDGSNPSHYSSQSNDLTKNNSLSQQSSIANLNSAKSKYQSNYSLSKQTFKNILYKQQQQPNHSNMLSISSLGSIDIKKTHQISKLSHLSSVQTNSTHNSSNVVCNHTHTNSDVSLKIAPKPPHQTTQPLNAKNQRDSREMYQKISLSKDLPEDDYSPKISPQRFLPKMHTEQNPIMVKQHSGSSQFSLNHTNQVSTNNTLSNSIDKGAQTNSIQAFKEQVEKSGSNTQRINGPNGKHIGRNNSQNFFKTTHMLNNIQSFLVQTPDGDQDFNKLTTTSVQQFDVEGTTSPLGHSSKQIQMVDSKNYKSTQRPQTTISGNFNMHTGMNQYLNNANTLLSTGNGKPPSKSSKQQLGFLSHNSSAKNLKLQSKNLALSLQTTQNSSRKLTKGGIPECEIIAEFPRSSRNNAYQSVVQKFTFSKPTSLSKERYQQNSGKSVDKQKRVATETIAEAMDSIEKKRQNYKSQKQSFNGTVGNSGKGNYQQSLTACSSQKTFTKQAVTRNHNGGILKGSSTTMINDFLKNSNKNQESNTNNTGSQHPAKQESFNRTMQRINKSLDKIKQIFMSNGSSKPVQVPQSTKNATAANDLVQQINSYKSFIKKSKPQESNFQSSTALTIQHTQNNLHAQKNKTLSQVPAPSKSSKDIFMMQYNNNGANHYHKSSNEVININSHGGSAVGNMHKKSTENFKKYLSGVGTLTGNSQNHKGYLSFK